MSTDLEKAQEKLEEMIKNGQFTDNMSEVAMPGIERKFEDVKKSDDKK